ncbi:APC family permease [Geodermatophilus sp. CPCC 205761]|uniref:APC family permease n=1 Tax=Geodermatophilus sp. CPCC 205761 TaxID=2936597 RepID=UPI003EED12DB
MTPTHDEVEATPHLHKTLTWKDGLALSIVSVNGLFVTLGFAVGVLGAWTAIAIWITGTVIGLLQNRLFAELAAMFPGKSGGVARYAIEGWKRYFAPLGAIASFGYWIGWSLAIAVTASALGGIIQAEWFAGSTSTVSFLGNELGLGHVFAIISVWAAWAVNYVGIRLAATVNKVVGVMVTVALVVVVVAALVQGQWDAANLTWGPGATFSAVIVWFYITAWTTYGVEIAASFAPEYKDTVRDTAKALKATSTFMLIAFVAIPIGVTGAIGEGTLTENPVGYITVAFDQLFGGQGWIGTLVLVFSLWLAMVSTTADGGRALYGLAQEGMTIRQLDWLNRWGVPGRSLTIDAVINTAHLLLLSSPVAILLASNLGYMTAITLGVGAFLLLRKDRPGWPRPIRRGRIWIPVATVIFVLNVFITLWGATHPSDAGYGGMRESLIGIGILALSVVLFVYRQVVQDRRPIQWRDLSEDSPSPEAIAAAAPPSAAPTVRDVPGVTPRS